MILQRVRKSVLCHLVIRFGSIKFKYVCIYSGGCSPGMATFEINTEVKEVEEKY